MKQEILLLTVHNFLVINFQIFVIISHCQQLGQLKEGDLYPKPFPLPPKKNPRAKLLDDIEPFFFFFFSINHYVQLC